MTRTIRLAAPADAIGISGLYEQAYRPEGGGEARDHYPFPQLFAPDWVAEAVSQDRICWVVAESEGAIIASAAAVCNIGSRLDRVAEVFGIVVEKRHRGKGVSTSLLGSLCRHLRSTADFVLCESRTAVAAGWKVSRRCGFLPLGYEPFAHFTPAGSESMVPTGRISADAAEKRETHRGVSPNCRGLAEKVLRSFRLAAPPLQPMAPKSTGNIEQAALPNREVPSVAVGAIHRRYDLASPAMPCLEVEKRSMLERESLDFWSHRPLHGSGVIGLRRFEGDDLLGQRYDRQFYVGRLARCELALARVVLDRVDQRARVLEMHTLRPGLQAIILSLIVYEMKGQAAGQPLTIVIDVLAHATQLHVTLEQLGFRPTVYYPGLVAADNGRADAVQYTALLNCAFEDSLGCLPELTWDQAREIVSQVRMYHSDL